MTISGKGYGAGCRFSQAPHTKAVDMAAKDMLAAGLNCVQLPAYEGNLNRSITFVFEEDAKAFFESMNIGEEYIPRQYLSTTKKGIYNDSGQMQIYIQHAKKGKDLGELAIEDEVLYPVGARFRVVNKVEIHDKYCILLEEA